MDQFECLVSGTVQQTPSGNFIACVSAKRTWERFTMQTAKMTSAPCATQLDAEALLERLLEDLKDIFVH